MPPLVFLTEGHLCAIDMALDVPIGYSKMCEHRCVQGGAFAYLCGTVESHDSGWAALPHWKVSC